MNKLKYILLVAFALQFLQTNAQSPVTDDQLAVRYYQNGEFDKALLYFERLYVSKPSKTYFDYYYKCLLELKDLKSADKLIKKAIKRNPSSFYYQIKKGELLKVKGEKSKAKEYYNKLIKTYDKTYSNTMKLANEFAEVNENQFALETYLEGRKKINKNYHLNRQIGYLYGVLGKNELMIDEFLDLLELNSGTITVVQGYFTRFFNFEGNDERVELLRKEMLKRLQKKNQHETIYSEMLIWYFMQKGEFQAAYTQTLALEKREKGEQNRLFQFGKLCETNEKYKLAAKSYQYIVDQIDSYPDGKGNFIYDRARINMIRVKRKLILAGNYTQEELLNLEREYDKSIEEIGQNAMALPLIRQRADLKSFYLQKPEAAEKDLREALEIPGVSKKEIALIKLQLSDVLVFNHNEWEAALYCMQVENDFKQGVIGHEAMFKNAKISYYLGEFDWAKDQLDALKASTSKLIANDAIELSLLISENSTLDSNYIGLKFFSEAELLIYQRKYEEAYVKLDSINEQFGFHALSDDILFKKGQIAEQNKKFEDALEYYSELIRDFGTDILADNALFRMAEINELQLNRLEKAKEYYKEILFSHTGSYFVTESRKRFRKLSEQEKEIK